MIKKTDSTKSSKEIISAFGTTTYKLKELYAANKAEEPLNIDDYDAYPVYPVEFLRKNVDFNISKNNITGNMLKLFLTFIIPEHKDKILEMATETCKKFIQKFPVCHHIFNEHYHDLFMPYSVLYLSKNQELNIEYIKQKEIYQDIIKKFDNIKNSNFHDFLHRPEIFGKVFIGKVTEKELANQRLKLLKNLFDTCKNSNDLNIIRNAYFTFFENIGFTNIKDMYLKALQELQVI